VNDAVRNTIAILGYNTWLFRNALKNVEPELVKYRVNEHTNTFDRLAGHVAVGRFGMARMLQIGVPDPGWGARPWMTSSQPSIGSRSRSWPNFPRCLSLS
jgi:hypothetical protein